MIIIFSPTKQMFSKPHISPVPEVLKSSPQFLEEAEHLNAMLSSYGLEELSVLMKMSPSLALKTSAMIQSFGSGPTREAIFAYRGTSFQALAAESMGLSELEFAQKHLRILSGMYGILNPLDEISPYRLEMKTPLSVGGEGNLSKFWKGPVNRSLANEPSLKTEESFILNLASEEYFRLIDPLLLKKRIITVSFKEKTPSGLKTVGMYAKRARGAFLKRILQKKSLKLDEIRALTADDYEYRKNFSQDDHWVFLRK